jgi:chromosome segregation ATPase
MLLAVRRELRERVEVLTEQVDQLINQKIDQPSEEVERSEVARLEERCVELEAELKRVTGEYNKDGEALKKKLAEAESEALRCRCEMEEAKHRATAVGEQAAAAETMQRQVTLLSAELKAAKEESEARAGEIQHATTAKNMEKREVEEAQRLLLATAAKMEKDIVALSEKVGCRHNAVITALSYRALSRTSGNLGNMLGVVNGDYVSRCRDLLGLEGGAAHAGLRQSDIVCG